MPDLVPERREKVKFRRIKVKIAPVDSTVEIVFEICSAQNM